MPPRRRAATSTSNFGVGRRESHVADAFYARFEAPELSDDEHVTPHRRAWHVCAATPATWTRVADNSVALVVTSPPYFAGKQYEEELDREGVPGSYIEYLELLRDVFADCKRVLEPGGRIAVNVANLGRKPYRSLSADVMSILQDDLHLLPRGEIIWQKGEGANGSCAWGSFRSAANPVLRDVTERVLVASKGRFGRAMSPKERQRDGLPFESSVGADDFMALTLDIWDVPPESAVRVQHPAPFPVELPQRLMELYTYRGDLVVDPFCGSGSTLVAAARSGGMPWGMTSTRRTWRSRWRASPVTRWWRVGRVTMKGPRPWPSPCGRSRRPGSATCARTAGCAGLGMAVSYSAVGAGGRTWYFDVAGTNSSYRGGMSKSETVWRALGRAHVMAAGGIGPLVVLTTQLPREGTEADRALRAPGPGGIFDVVDLLSAGGAQRLRSYAKSRGGAPLPGFWAERDLAPGSV